MTGNIPDEWFRPEAADTTPRLPVVDAQTPTHITTPAPVVPPPQPPRRLSGRRKRILAISAVIGALLLGLLIGQAFRGGQQNPTRPASGASPPATPTASAGASVAVGEVYSGAVNVIRPLQITASCTAPDAQDSLGQPVTYRADLVSDNLLDTAWRCDGDAVGQTLTFTLPADSEIVRVAVFNGYGKNDPKTGERMYPQYRRLTAVRWQLPNGDWFSQSFSDNGAGLQAIDLPRTKVSGAITMTIVSVTGPGWTNSATRNAVLVSEVQFFGPA